MMKFTEVRLTLGYTYNLGDYSNVRPEITLTAELDDDLQVALNSLYETARNHCYRMIDEALEANEKPAKFSDEPRFVAYSCHDEKLAVIVLENLYKQFESEHPHWNRTIGFSCWGGYRYHHLRDLLKNRDEKDGFQILDFRFDTLPHIEHVFETNIGNMLIIGRGKQYNVLPPYLLAYRDREKTHTRNFDTFEAEMRLKASEQGLTFLNISDFDDWQYEEEIKELRIAYEERQRMKEQQLDEEEDDYDDEEDE